MLPMWMHALQLALCSMGLIASIAHAREAETPERGLLCFLIALVCLCTVVLAFANIVSGGH
jgi:hypothetical protein